MTELILHHYPLSPYSEKIRAMLGYCGMSWQSAITSEMPPRPQLAPLAGGYGRIPVAQIGADIFCDSQTISAEIARISQRPELNIESASQEVVNWVKDAEGDVFFACVMAAGGPALRKKVVQSMSYLNIARLLFDRIRMSRKAKIKMVGVGEAKPVALAFLDRMETQLLKNKTSFLFGDQPDIADFSSYHCLWFLRDMGGKTYIARKYPTTLSWLDRIKAYKEGIRKEIKPRQAIDIARNNQPREIASEFTRNSRHKLIGQQVSITPNDYRLDATLGELVGVTDHQYIITYAHRETERVHIHFPREGYDLVSG